MVDYYEELDISPSLGLDEIKQALVRLSKVYEKREADGFEIAREKLVLINKAETVFKTENTRKQYDRELADRKGESNKSIDPIEERKAQYKQWFKRASEYYQSGEYDSAKIAIDRAFRNVSPNDDDAKLYSLAADIYRLNGELKSALDYVVEAIVLDEENVSSHITKYHIYEDLENSNYNDRANYSVHKRLEILVAAERIAKKDRSPDVLAQVHDLLAFAWYENGRGDVSMATEYAILALNVLPNAENAKRVLEHIKQTQKMKDEQERQRLEAEQQRAEFAKQQLQQQEEAKEKNRKIEIATMEQKNKNIETKRKIEIGYIATPFVLAVVFVLAGSPLWAYLFGVIGVAGLAVLLFFKAIKVGLLRAIIVIACGLGAFHLLILVALDLIRNTSYGWVSLPILIGGTLVGGFGAIAVSGWLESTYPH